MAEKKDLSFQKIIESYKEVINELRSCTDCSKCEEQNKCRIYLRQILSVVVEWIFKFTISHEECLSKNPENLSMFL